MQRYANVFAPLLVVISLVLALGLLAPPSAAETLQHSPDHGSRPDPEAKLWLASGSPAGMQSLERLHALAEGAAAPQAIAACNANPTRDCVFAEALALQRSADDRQLVWASILAQIGAADESPALIDEAFAIARTIEPALWDAFNELMQQIALLQSEAGRWPEAWEAADALSGFDVRDVFLWDIVERAARSSHLNEAVATSQRIREPLARDQALAAIARAQAAAGLGAEARATADAMEDRGFQLGAIARIAAAEGRVDDLAQALVISEDLLNRGQRYAALLGIVTAYAEMGAFEEAISLIETRQGYVEENYLRIARAQLDAGFLEAALATAGNHVALSPYRVPLFLDIATASDDPEIIDAALAGARTRLSALGSGPSFGQIAEVQARTGRVAEALATAREPMLPIFRGFALAQVGRHLPN